MLILISLQSELIQQHQSITSNLKIREEHKLQDYILQKNLIILINFISKRDRKMKISKKTLTKWEIEQFKPQSLPKTIQNRTKEDKIAADVKSVLGLPRHILQQPKVAEVKMLIMPARSSYDNYVQNSEVKAIQAMQREYYNQLRSTLKNRTKQLFRPLKKHHSVLDTIKVDSEDDKTKMKISKKAPISSEHSSQKALSILQKIILKQVDFYANKKRTVMELQASKLPLIQFKESKRRQSLAAYETKFVIPNAAIIKYQTVEPKTTKISVNKQKQKPYFSGWDVNEANDF